MKLRYTIVYLAIVLPSVVFADPKATFENPLDSGDIPALLSKVLHLLVQIGIPVLVIFIVYAGLKFVTAQGNATKIEEAKKALFWAIIGGAVLLGADIISRVIKATVEKL